MRNGEATQRGSCCQIFVVLDIPPSWILYSPLKLPTIVSQERWHPLMFLPLTASASLPQAPLLAATAARTHRWTIFSTSPITTTRRRLTINNSSLLRRTPTSTTWHTVHWVWGQAYTPYLQVSTWWQSCIIEHYWWRIRGIESCLLTLPSAIECRIHLYWRYRKQWHNHCIWYSLWW